jgi:DNA-binding GntR family transcriptional regulator
VVASMTIDDVEEVCSLRLALEVLALRYSIDRAQEDNLQMLHITVDQLSDCLGEDFSLERAVDLDLWFHEEFVKSAQHNRVLSMWQSIKPQIWFLIFSRNAFALENFRESLKSHADLVDSIERQDYETGKANLTTHLQIDYSTLIANYKKLHEPDDSVH